MVPLRPSLNIFFTSPAHRNIWGNCLHFRVLADLPFTSITGGLEKLSERKKAGGIMATGFQRLVLVTGIEPATYCLQDSCATVAPHQLQRRAYYDTIQRASSLPDYAANLLHAYGCHWP